MSVRVCVPFSAILFLTWGQCYQNKVKRSNFNNILLWFVDQTKLGGNYGYWSKNAVFRLGKFQANQIPGQIKERTAV